MSRGGELPPPAPLGPAPAPARVVRRVPRGHLGESLWVWAYDWPTTPMALAPPQVSSLAGPGAKGMARAWKRFHSFINLGWLESSERPLPRLGMLTSKGGRRGNGGLGTLNGRKGRRGEASRPGKEA